jgi:hypothetical protein
LVGDVFGSEGVEHRHDPPGKIKVGGTAVGNQNACMGALLAERRLVQPFIVAAIVREHRQLVFGGKVLLCRIGTTKILGIPCGEYVEPVRAEQLRKQDRHIFIEVQLDEERGLGHWRRG